MESSANLKEKLQALADQNMPPSAQLSTIAILWASMNTLFLQLCGSQDVILDKHTSFIKNFPYNMYATYIHYTQPLLQSCKTMPPTLKKSSNIA